MASGQVISRNRRARAAAGAGTLTIDMANENGRGMRRSWLIEFWQYHELLYFMVWRDLKVRYKQTLLGVAWAIIQPLFSTAIFFLFFGKIAKMPSDGIP